MPLGRIPVLDVQPCIDHGDRPAKSVVGEPFDVTATVFREGHDAVAATVVLTDPDGAETHVPMVCVNPGLSHWVAEVSADRIGWWSYRVEGWSDPWGTWLHDATVKIDVGVDEELMLAEGVTVLERALDVPGRTPHGRQVIRDAVAALMGHADSDDLLTEVTEASRTIAWALDAAGRRAGQSQRARTLRVGPRRPAMAPLGYGFFRHDGEAVLGSTQQVGTDAELPLRAAVVAARSKLPIAPRTLANLAASPDVVTPWPASTLHQLTDLLSVGPELVTTWEALDQAGLVERWIPEWAAVRSRPQRNAVHRHTVDRHLVETVVEAARLSRDVQRPDLLLMAALLHDIGKIAGALDHSAEGAIIATGILQRLGMPADDAATVVLLVREHLTLMDTATRRDLDDPSTITAVVDLVDGRARIVGAVPCGYVYVDGSSVGEADEELLKDRRILRDEGFIAVMVVVDSQEAKVLAGPEITARGFAEDDEIFAQVRPKIVAALDEAMAKGVTDPQQLQQVIRRAIGGWVGSKIRRRPMIIPTVIGA